MSAEEEIQAGLLNALDRGIPLEKAVQSFLNAGYSEAAVKAAARAVSEGNVLLPHVDAPSPESPPPAQPTVPPVSAPSPAPAISRPAQVSSSSSMPMQKAEVRETPAEEGVSKTKIIILVVVLVILLGVLAASFLFRDQIAGLLA